MEKVLQEDQKKIVVCILAYNEQTHITNTIQHIINGNKDMEYTLKVYANGCTDNTVKIVRELEKVHLNLELRELEIASKPLAWNSAFNENKNEILMFADADVILEPGSIKDLYSHLTTSETYIAATAQYTPHEKGLSFEKKLTGFMQLPIEQEYISGHFYAIKREIFVEKFSKHNISGLPDGIVGEDLFIDLLVPQGQLAITNKKCFYEPGTIEEYAKYFARMRWQREQMKNVFEKLNISCDNCFTKKKTITLIKDKWGRSRDRKLFLFRFIPAVLRHIFLFSYKNKINNYYTELGPVVEEGAHILRETRSDSTK